MELVFEILAALVMNFEVKIGLFLVKFFEKLEILSSPHNHGDFLFNPLVLLLQ